MNLLVPLKVSTALCSVKIAPSFSERCILGCGITAFNSTLTFNYWEHCLNNRHNSSQACEVGAGAILAIASTTRV